MNMKVTKKRMIYTLLVTIIVVFSTTFAILMTLERNDYRNYLQGEYSKNMYGLVNEIDNIEDNLSKSSVSGTREQRIMMLQDIFHHASIADDRLHSLPIPQETSSETSKFLTQVGDYSYALMKASMNGGDISDKDSKTIDKLREQSYTLENHLNNILAEINEGRVRWGEIRRKVSGALASNSNNLVSTKFQTIQKQVVQYPSLIYDGPFSDNTLDIKPRVNDLTKVSLVQAEAVINKALGKNKIQSIEVRNVTGKTKIDVYSFNVTMKGRGKNEKIVCEVSKHGGRLVYLLDSRRVLQPTVDSGKASAIGAKFLSSIGYENMQPSYALKYEDTVIINYVYNFNKIPIYPDQINLKIALDKGNVIGVEAQKYLISHVDNRTAPRAKISETDARRNVSGRLAISKSRLVVIPTDTNKEVLCYEYTGTYNKETFLVYINAETGEPQNILKLVNTPNGTLTM